MLLASLKSGSDCFIIKAGSVLHHYTSKEMYTASVTLKTQDGSCYYN